MSFPRGAVLALAGSPRPGGNTDRLLAAFLEPLRAGGRRVEAVWLRELVVEPCRHCDGCRGTGVCVIRDDMDGLYRGLDEAEALVLASPVFFLTVGARMKAVIDRSQALWAASRLTGAVPRPRRPAALVAAAGQAGPKTFDCTLTVVRAFLATAGFRLQASVLAGGLDNRDDLDGRPETLDEARTAGEQFSRVLST